MTLPEYKELLLEEWSLWREKENQCYVAQHLKVYCGVSCVWCVVCSVCVVCHMCGVPCVYGVSCVCGHMVCHVCDVSYVCSMSCVCVLCCGGACHVCIYILVCTSGVSLCCFLSWFSRQGVTQNLELTDWLPGLPILPSPGSSYRWVL